MRAKLLALLVVGLCGCAQYEPIPYGESSIVFGVEQTKDADGKVTTSAGYELLELGGRGWYTRGFVARDKACWIEKLDGRLGRPRFEGGTASFIGGRLPIDGLVVHANQNDDTKFEGAAWAAGERLRFQAAGFAMPDIGPYEIPGPSTELTIDAPAVDAPAVVKDDFVVTWQPGTVPVPERVVVVLGVETTEVRCFFDRALGTGKIPRELLLGLPATNATTPGTLQIATHQQLTVVAPGNWVVYVVASVSQRRQAFTLAR